MKSLLVAAAVLATVVTACSPLGTGRTAPTAPELSPPAEYRIYVASREGVVGVDPASGKTEARLPASLLAPDGKSAFALTGDGRTLEVLDPLTGAITRRLSLPGLFQFQAATLYGLPGGLSQNGRWLTLSAFDPPPRDGPTRRTTFLVVDTSFATPARILPLDGRFEYGGISEDGHHLFLTEWLRRVQHSHGLMGAYQARLYDLEQRSWSPSPVADKAQGSELAGMRLAGLTSPDGAWQYTLFMAGDAPAFIHAQSLRELTDWRINLPPRQQAEENSADDFVWTMDVTRDGRQLFAVNPLLGQVVVLETSVAAGAKPRIIRQARIQPARAARSLFWTDAHAKRFVIAGAVLSPDASTLYAVGDAGLLALNTSDLSLRARWATRLEFMSLALTPDGKWLFGLTGGTGELIAIDVRTGAAARAIPTHATDAVAIVGVQTR